MPRESLEHDAELRVLFAAAYQDFIGNYTWAKSAAQVLANL